MRRGGRSGILKVFQKNGDIFEKKNENGPHHGPTISLRSGAGWNFEHFFQKMVIQKLPIYKGVIYKGVPVYKGVSSFRYVNVDENS